MRKLCCKRLSNGLRTIHPQPKSKVPFWAAFPTSAGCYAAPYEWAAYDSPAAEGQSTLLGCLPYQRGVLCSPMRMGCIQFTRNQRAEYPFGLPSLPARVILQAPYEWAATTHPQPKSKVPFWANHPYQRRLCRKRHANGLHTIHPQPKSKEPFWVAFPTSAGCYAAPCEWAMYDAPATAW